MGDEVSNLVFVLIGAVVLATSVAGVVVAARPGAVKFAGLAYGLSWLAALGSVVLIVVAIVYDGRDRLVDNDLIVPGAAAALLFALLAVVIRARTGRAWT